MPHLDWIDGFGQPWRIELAPDSVVLRGANDAALEFARPRWGQDIFISRHGESVVIRFDSFEGGASFLVPAATAEPLIRHLSVNVAPELHVEDDRLGDPEPTAPALLWPRVSRLAVWALICSSLVFLPVIGIAPAIATVVLLILHRRRVRAAAVYRHSRALCRVAVGFLVFGLATSALATLGTLHHLSRADLSLTEVLEARGRGVSADRLADSTPERNPNAAASVSPMTLLGQSIFKRDINWAYVVAALVVIFFALSVHEAAHAVTAWWLGDDFARRLGRVTLNPIMHIDPIGTVLLPAIMAVVGAPIFGWARPVPVRLDYVPNPRRASVLVSIAGPGSNLLIAAASLALMLAIGTAASLLLPGTSVSFFGFLSGDMENAWAGVLPSIFTILQISFLTNVVLAAFNMIPLPPLDGSWVLAAWFPRTVGQFYMRIRPYSFLIFIILIYSDVFRYLFYPVGLFVIAPSNLLLELATGAY